jgi:2-C-methyl-D-erythritol 4-phosphate cytidylyltransferase
MSVVALVPVVGDTPLLTHAVDGLVSTGAVDRVVVVPVGTAVGAVPGATVAPPLPPGTRTVRAADHLAPGDDVLLLHDPARAAPPTLVGAVVAAVRAHGRPVLPALPCSDTVKRVDDAGLVVDTPDRAGLRVAQTPVGYPAAPDVEVRLDGTAPVGAVVVAGAVTEVAG